MSATSRSSRAWLLGAIAIAACLGCATAGTAPVGPEDAPLEDLLGAAKAFAGWESKCGGDGRCLFARQIPVRDGRPEDVLHLGVLLGHPDDPDSLLIAAPNRAEKSPGVGIAFISGLIDEGPRPTSIQWHPLLCDQLWCEAQLPLSTKLEDGSDIGSQLSSAGMLWIIYVLDGKPTRALVTLAPLRSAIAASKR